MKMLWLLVWRINRRFQLKRSLRVWTLISQLPFANWRDLYSFPNSKLDTWVSHPPAEQNKIDHVSLVISLSCHIGSYSCTELSQAIKNDKVQHKWRWKKACKYAEPMAKVGLHSMNVLLSVLGNSLWTSSCQQNNNCKESIATNSTISMRILKKNTQFWQIEKSCFLPQEVHMLQNKFRVEMGNPPAPSVFTKKNSFYENGINKLLE